MNTPMNRRRFLQAAAAAAATAAASPRPGKAQTPSASAVSPQTTASDATSVARETIGPVVLASGNGLRATAKAAEMILAGADPLDAVVAGVGIVEADPEDHTVGIGGIPNEDGVVQLDASVMHGPTHRAGAVAALENILHPAQVAQLVMQRTDHVLLVGAGALRFAKAHGFPEVNLLTDASRRIWLRWKESHSDQDDWITPAEEAVPLGQAHPHDAFTYGTIHCCALDVHGNLAGVTTTSGLSYKLSGRVGDSPIIGAGLYVDNEVGAAGATGRGESVILNAGAFSVVEQMRSGLSPEEACLAVVKRIADRTRDPRLLRDDGRPDFQVTLYALAKDGRCGSAAIWSNTPGHNGHAVHHNGQNRHAPTAFLYKHDEKKR